MKLLSDLNISGKRVFVRADLDIPLETRNLPAGEAGWKLETGQIRLQSIKPTVDYLLAHAAKQIIIAGHIDRPSFAKAAEGKPPGYDPALSTKHLVPTLEKILGQKITFKDVILGISQLTETPESDSGQVLRLRSGQLKGSEANRTARMTGESKVVLFENLRFWPGETENDPDFAKNLASLADCFVNEAFGNCHRNHASIVGLPNLLPDVEDPDGIHSRRAAGLHLEKEIQVLSKILDNPQRPFVAIIGGAKIETKLPLVEHLAKIADFVLVGGEIALENQKYNSKVKIAAMTQDTKDISNESIYQFKDIIAKAKTIVWNGPMGLFEEGFDAGTKAVAEAIIESKAESVVGGGETTQFLAKNNLLSPPAGGFSFVSSGGGAMLEFLSGSELPGIKALE